MEKLREIEVNNRERLEKPYRGYFHQWSQITDSGSSYPVAIIEDMHGQVHSVPVWAVKFISNDNI